MTKGLTPPSLKAMLTAAAMVLLLIAVLTGLSGCGPTQPAYAVCEEFHPSNQDVCIRKQYYCPNPHWRVVYDVTWDRLYCEWAGQRK